MTFNLSDSAVRRLVAIPLAIVLIVAPTLMAMAAQLPHPGSNLFIQTSGPSAGLNIGDYYTSPAGGNTTHLFIVRVPSNWPAGEFVTISLYDPELAGPNPSSPPALDEIRGSTDAATYTLMAPSGVAIAAATYSDASTNGAWAHLATFDPATNGVGTYELEVTVSDNDDNSWRLDASFDPDCVVGGPGTCAGVVDGDESDTAPSGSGPLGIGVLRTSYQHGAGGNQCQDHIFYVNSVTARPLRAHNFDMDNSGTVTYTDPNGVDHTGTVSANGRWNNSADATRVGDILADVNGWWSAEVCISSGNQYVFEAPGASPTFPEPQPTPRLTITKSDGVDTAVVGDTLVYSIEIANVSDTDPLPDDAYNVRVSDTLPTGLSFVSCSAVGVDCTESGGTVSAVFNDNLEPGDTTTITIEVEVGPDATPTILNEATVSYDDRLGSAMPTETSSDSDEIDLLPVLDVTASGPSAVLRGDLAVVSFAASHDASSDGSAVYSPVFTCADCDTVSYLSGDVNTNGILEDGESWIYETSRATDGATPDPLSLAGDISGQDGNGEDVMSGTTHDIDIVESGTVAGNVFEDLNGNGVLDSGEPGIDVADVTLSQGGGDIATRTPTGGAYLFDPLFPGEYTVTVEELALPAGLNPTSTPGPVMLAEGGAVTGVDFGYAYPVTVSGLVFEDSDMDGTTGAGEAGIGSVVVSLLDSNGDVVDSAVTSLDGEYSFVTMPGEYTISVVSGTPEGWDFTTPEVLSLGWIVSGANVDASAIGMANQAPELLESSQSIYLDETTTNLPSSDPEGSDVSFAIAGGSLPAGLSLESDGSFTGTADETGVFNLQIELCDSGDPSACAVYDWQLNVSQPPPSVSGVQTLPFTGAESGPFAGMAILMLVAGAGVVFSARPRSER